MDKNLLAVLLKDVVIPEVLAVVRAHMAATNAVPTEAEVLAALQIDADRLAAVGQAFLDRNAATT